jgi:hypothetical protein
MVRQASRLMAAISRMWQCVGEHSCTHGAAVQALFAELCTQPGLVLYKIQWLLLSSRRLYGLECNCHQVLLYVENWVPTGSPAMKVGCTPGLLQQRHCSWWWCCVTCGYCVPDSLGGIFFQMTSMLALPTTVSGEAGRLLLLLTGR